MKLSPLRTTKKVPHTVTAKQALAQTLVLPDPLMAPYARKIRVHSDRFESGRALRARFQPRLRPVGLRAGG